MDWLRIMITGVLIILFSNLQAQLFHRKTNQYDTSGKRSGLWITWWDDEARIPMSKARFKEGKETGVSKEYHQNGTLRLKMRYFKHNQVKVKYYNENRQLEQKGRAVFEYNRSDIHYYWHGNWKFYDTHHKIKEFAIYYKGEELSRKQAR